VFKRFIVLLLVFMLLFPAGIAMAEGEGGQQGLNAEAILKVVQDAGVDVSSEEGVSRGAFAAMLTFAAGISEAEVETLPFIDMNGDEWYFRAVGALHQAGILRGFPDGRLYGENPITGIEAAALLARTLGVMEGPDTEVEVGGIQRDHWAYTLYSWLMSEGFQLNNDQLLRPILANEAAQFLAKAFYTDEEAKSIIEKSNKTGAEVKTLKVKGQMIMQIQMEGQDGETATVKPTASFNSQFSREGIIHQTVETSIPGIDTPVKIEQYMDKDYIYTNALGEDGENVWFKMKNPFPQALDQKYLSQQQDMMTSMDEITHYRIIGKEILQDRDIYKIAIYSRFDDFSKIFDMMGYLSSEEQQNLKDANRILKNIFIRGTIQIDSKDFLVHYANLTITAVMDPKEQQESPQAIKSMVIEAFYDYYDYNVDANIQIPAEAQNAEEIVPQK
jgi:hypothetical protein